MNHAGPNKGRLDRFDLQPQNLSGPQAPPQFTRKHRTLMTHETSTCEGGRKNFYVCLCTLRSKLSKNDENARYASEQKPQPTGNFAAKYELIWSASAAFSLPLVHLFHMRLADVIVRFISVVPLVCACKRGRGLTVLSICPVNRRKCKSCAFRSKLRSRTPVRPFSVVTRARAKHCTRSAFETERKYGLESSFSGLPQYGNHTRPTSGGRVYRESGLR